MGDDSEDGGQDDSCEKKKNTLLTYSRKRFREKPQIACTEQVINPAPAPAPATPEKAEAYPKKKKSLSLYDKSASKKRKIGDANSFGCRWSLRLQQRRKVERTKQSITTFECAAAPRRKAARPVVNEEEREGQKEALLEHIHLFMSCMHLILGDRKFSQWKGSVMDSIGGAFLAQNTNDVFSSSAFMSLAAKFPRGGRKKGPNAKTVETRNCRRQGIKKEHDPELLNVLKKGRKARTVEAGNCRGQGIKKEHDPELLNVLKKCNSKYRRKKKVLEASDAIDWDAVRRAEVSDISEAIELRGMSYNLATRMKNCVNTMVENFGSTDMEWIRDVPSDKAKEYLLNIYGMGLKSVECIRLLTLRQKAFPIDINAGRVAVRLGWVPLKELKEGEEFHLLKRYPKLNAVQTYLWMHLRDLDLWILYELHCQMITFGKVFCTKRNPNCYECPMKAECKYFASMLASGSKKNRSCENLMDIDMEDYGVIVKCGSSFDMHESTIPLEELRQSSLGTVAVKKKTSTTLLSTEHQVYLLPDWHDLLDEVELREMDDPCRYLLAVWSPESLDGAPLPPLEEDDDDDAVYGTLLIPARTATRGLFPLNGTFFQANEVFADHESSETPIKVPKASLANLLRSTLYCGSTISTICRGMTSVQVQKCFKEGFVCFRGFSRKTREPKPLPPRFHLEVVKAEKQRQRRSMKKKKKTSMELQVNDFPKHS